MPFSQKIYSSIPRISFTGNELAVDSGHSRGCASSALVTLLELYPSDWPDVRLRPPRFEYPGGKEKEMRGDSEGEDVYGIQQRIRYKNVNAGKEMEQRRRCRWVRTMPKSSPVQPAKSKQAKKGEGRPTRSPRRTNRTKERHRKNALYISKGSVDWWI
jgi:hypothetical protein